MTREEKRIGRRIIKGVNDRPCGPKNTAANPFSAKVLFPAFAFLVILLIFMDCGCNICRNLL